MKWLILLMLCTILLTACAQEPLTKLTVHTENKDLTFYTTIANSQDEHARGLMNVSKLPKNQDMLFIFKDEKPRRFWMKGTLIPLDMLFINSKGKIINIIHNAQPEQPRAVYTLDNKEQQAYTIHSSKLPAQYVLELNGNSVKELNIQIGDTVSW